MSKDNGTALQTSVQSIQAAVRPQTLAEYKELARIICNGGGFCPDAMHNKPEMVMCAMMAGAELGLTAFQSVQNIFLVHGKPCVYTSTLRALVEASGLLAGGPVVSYKGSIEKNDLTCTVKVKRRGKEWEERSFSMGDARQAGLWGQGMGWKKYPNRMLMHRAMGWVLQDEFPDVARGIRTYEEMTGSDAAPDIYHASNSQIGHTPSEPVPVIEAEIEEPQEHEDDASQIDLETVLQAIQSALTVEALADLIPVCRSLNKEQEAKANQAYKLRLLEIRKGRARAATPPKAHDPGNDDFPPLPFSEQEHD